LEHGVGHDARANAMRSLKIIFSLIILIITPAHAAPVKKVIEGVTYHIIRAQAASVRIVWKDDHGAALRTFQAAARFLTGKGTKPDTLMNGGIFEPGGIPSGLLIQDGMELNPVNRNRGEGNFFLQPNGIFLIGSAGASVIGTDEYPVKGIVIRHAVQSGPLLLRRNRIHPAFNANSTSRLHRNGVGVATNGEVVFAMTDLDSAKFPNLHEFAALFRTLGCEDALFLDGVISQMRSGEDINKPNNQLGSIIAIMETR
jgi:uncharacterized protein YigE (DUF2233 family)